MTHIQPGGKPVRDVKFELKKSKFSTQECIETKDGGSQLLKKRNDLLNCGMCKDKSLSHLLTSLKHLTRMFLCFHSQET